MPSNIPIQVPERSVMRRPIIFQQQWSHRLRSLSALLFLACTSVALFSPVVLGGRFFGLDDPGVQIYPALSFFGRYLRDYGQVPLWNSFILSGEPQYLSSSATVGGFFYPVQFLYAMFSMLPLYHWLLVVYFVLAAWCTFAVSRRIQLSVSASTIAACAATFNQFTIAWGINNVNYYVFWILPALLWILLRMDALAAHGTPLQARSRHFLLSWGVLFLGGTATIGLTLLAGHPQFILYALTAAALAAFFLDNRRAAAVAWYRRRFPVTMSLVLMAIGGVLIGSVQLIPSALFVSATSRAAMGYEDITRGSLNPLTSIRLLWPTFEVPYVIDWSGVYLYFGVLPLILATYALTRWRRDWRVRLFLLIAAFGVAAALTHSPIQRLLFHIPPYSLFRGPTRWTWIATVSSSFLAGIGWDYARSNGFTKRFARTWCILLLGSTALLLAIHSLVQRNAAVIVTQATHLLTSRLHRLTSGSHPVAHYAEIIQGLVDAVLSSTNLMAAHMRWATVFVLLSTLLVLTLRNVTPKRERVLSIVLPAVIALNLVSTAALTTVPGSLRRQVPPTVQAILSDSAEQQMPSPFRVFFYGRSQLNRLMVSKQLSTGEQWEIQTATLTPNTNMDYGLESIEGYDNFVSTGYSQVLSALDNPPERVPGRLVKALVLLSQMNVRYIVSLERLEAPTLTLVAENPLSSLGATAYVYRNEAALRRFHWARGGSDGITLISRRSGRYELDVNPAKPDELVLSEANLPQWHALIDGEDVPIHSIQYIYQGISVPAGQHHVQWEYVGFR